MADRRPYLAAAMCTAAALGDVAKMEELLALDATLVNAHDYDLRTPLHVSASQGRERVVELLLSHNANVNKEDRWLGTPLQDALRQDNDTIVSLLRQHGGIVGNREELVGALLAAAASGDLTLLQKKLREGADVNAADYDGRTALHLASANGHCELVSLLLSRNADPNPEDRFGGTPMFDAVRHQHDDVVRILSAAGARMIESDSNVAVLCLAAMEGNLDVVRRLLDGGSNINAGDYDQRTALHLASAEGHTALVTFLLSRGANPNALDRWGTTPLDDAEHHHHTAVIELLRAAGATHGVRNQDEDTRIIENRMTFTSTRAAEPQHTIQDLIRLGVKETVLLLRDALRFPAFCRRAADALATMLRKDADCEQPPASLLKERAVFVESLGLDLVGEVLATFSDNNDTRQSCLSIFSSIAEQDTIGAEIARVGAVRMALEATKSLHAETVVRAVECLFHTTFPQMSDAMRITELFVRENGINILLETLRHYQEEARVVDKCCATLWNILQTDESSLKRVERALGLTIVCEAWKLHENHENVVASAAGLVTRLIQRNAMKLEFVVDHRGSEMTISSLKRHLNSKFTVSACLSVLANLCIAPKGDIKSDKCLPAVIERTKAVALLLDIIRTYADDVWMIENAAHTLHVTLRSCSKPVALMSQIRAMKGKEMVDSAAKRFPNSEIIADIHADFHRHGASGCVIS